MKRTLAASLVGFLALAVGGAVVEAQQREQPQPPRTKVEAFEAQEGVVVVRGFSKIGDMKGVYGGVVSVQSMEFTNAATGKKEYGVTIEVKEASRLEREDRSFIDYDEIGSLIKGIDYISKVDRSATKLDSFQADYRTKGEFAISTFSSANDIMCSISSGRIGRVSTFFKIADLAKFRNLIVNAKAKLDSIKVP